MKFPLTMKIINSKVDEAFIVSQITFIICSIQEGGKKIESAQAHA